MSSLPDGKHNSKAYSVSFDGSGDYLGVTGTSDVQFGTGAFTAECFVYANSLPGSGVYGIFDTGSAVNSNRFSLVLYPSGKIYIDSNANLLISTHVLTPNTWNHIAFVREGTGSNQAKLYINGVLSNQATINTDFSNDDLLIGKTIDNLGWNGYISNVRIVKGRAVYTSNFTPPTTTLTNVSNTTLLCCQDSNATTGVVVPNGVSITANGDAAATNSKNPFLYNSNGDFGVNTGTSNTTKITIPHLAADTLYYYCSAHSGMGSSINVTTDIRKADPYAWKCVLALPLLGSKDDVSASINVNSTTKTTAITGNAEARSDRWDIYSGAFYFDSTADYIQATPTAGTTLADNTAPYTIEFFFSMNNGRFGDNTYNLMWSTSSGLSIAKWRSGISNKVYFESEGNQTGWGVQTQEDIDSIRWYHFAAVRNGNTITTYLDGVPQGTATSTYSASAETWWRVGGQNADGSCHAGYIQDFRIYNGVAKYTEDFSRVSTTPDVLPDTPSGITGKTNLTKITEGAVSFDGSGDYLSFADSNDWDIGTNPFTIECFVNIKPSSASYSGIFGMHTGSTQFQLRINNVGRLQFLQDFGGTRGNESDNDTSGTNLRDNSWHHVALTRQSDNSWQLYVDGIVEYSGTGMTGNITGINEVALGRRVDTNSYYLDGFISNFRFVSGTALYTSNFTPPTEPLTAVTNTKLLCCQSTTSAVEPAVVPFAWKDI